MFVLAASFLIGWGTSPARRRRERHKAAAYFYKGLWGNIWSSPSNILKLLEWKCHKIACERLAQPYDANSGQGALVCSSIEVSSCLVPFRATESAELSACWPGPGPGPGHFWSVTSCRIVLCDASHRYPNGECIFGSRVKMSFPLYQAAAVSRRKEPFP